MLSWPMLEGGLAGNIIYRQAPEAVERDERVVVEEGAGITRIERRKNKTRHPAVRLVGVGLTVTRGTAQSVSVATRRE